MTTKNRTIRWELSVDELAQHLAAERGYFPERANGGVSAFLADLVKEEDREGRLSMRKPTAGYAAHIRQSKNLSDAILKKGRNKAG